jgi:hypothetical protein
MRPRAGADTQRSMVEESAVMLDDETRFFFVGGAPKSGTTWMQRALDLHPEVVCSGEGHFHEFIARPVAQMARQWNEKFAVVSAAVYEGRPYYAPISRADQIEIARAIISMLMRRRRKPGARLIGDKTPANAQVVDDFAVMFPTMKFIAMMRDPRDVAASRLGHAVRRGALDSDDHTAPIRRNIVRAAALDWRRVAERVRDFAAKRPDQLIVVRYEDLLTQTGPQLARVFAFLGVETSPAQLAEIVEASRFEAFSGGRTPGVEDATSFYRKGVAGDWANTLDPTDLATLRKLCAEAMPSAGYEIDETWPRI